MSVYTTGKSIDGFGAQYQKIIQTYIYCKLHGLTFAYTPFNEMEHNYTNDPIFTKNKENLINLYNNIQLANPTSQPLDYVSIVRTWYDYASIDNINIACDSQHMSFIKKTEWCGTREYRTEIYAYPTFCGLKNTIFLS